MARRGTPGTQGDRRWRSSSSYGVRSGGARGSRYAAPQTASMDPSARIAWALVLFAVVALILVGRLVFLTLIDGPALAEKAADTRIQNVTVEAKRGTIYDRNGSVLATSVEAITVYCNPFEVSDPSATSYYVAEALGGQPADYTDALTAQGTSFAYLKRKADVDAANALRDKALAGVYFLPDTKRVYPAGQTAGQIVGMCDVDGNGISGLELYYDEVLSGEDGEMQVERGRNGVPVAGGLREVKAAVNGQDIVVSVDLEMQEYLETRLTQTVRDAKGKRGIAMLYDGGTGEVIAAASTPYLNPADRSTVEEGASTLMAVSSQFEPGSTFKTVTASAILEAGSANPQTVVFCPEYLEADEYTVSDSHERDAMDMTFAEVMSESSNVGISLLAEQMGFAPLYDKIKRYGLTERTGVDFPGEAEGYSTEQRTWSKIRSYNVSFGQGIMVSPLQMCYFYGALVNDGVEVQPHFLLQYPQSGEVPEYPTTQAIQNTAAIAPLTAMLQGVVEDGTGSGAQIEGFKPAGKTGTAQYTDETGNYADEMYNISFIGYLPDTNSKLVCFVGVTEVAYGGNTSDTFKDIMTFAINHYKITPQ